MSAGTIDPRRYALWSLIPVCLWLNGCASYADKNVAYRESSESPVLVVPAGLDAPGHERPLTIPPVPGGAPSAEDEPLDVSAPNIIEDARPSP